MDSTGSMGQSKSDWTPELRLQRFKERVTAILAFLLVMSTLLLTYLAFGMVGEDNRMRDAMGVLSLMFGLAGVVVGYYFGRVPGDARAVQAQQTTDSAMKQVSSANSEMAKAMHEVGAANNTVRQMAGKAQQIQGHLSQNLAESEITLDKLAVGPPSEKDIERLRRIILLLEQEIAELQGMAAR
jgi:preprotein translocase subunit SecG